MRVTAFIRQKDASKNDLGSRASVDDDIQNLFDAQVKELTGIIAKDYYIGADSEWLRKTIFAYHHPNAYSMCIEATMGNSFVECAERYIQCKQFDSHQECNIRSLIAKVKHFENLRGDITLNIDNMTADDLREFESLIKDEFDLSINSVITNMTMVRTICNWVRKQEAISNDPFFGYEMPKSLYGTPFFLTLQERDQVFECDLSDNHDLNEYRDMFVFQCMVGFRYGDLVNFTPINIIDGVLEYIPNKTIGKSGHANGSVAFARYRVIDDDIKKSLVKLIQ